MPGRNAGLVGLLIVALLIACSPKKPPPPKPGPDAVVGQGWSQDQRKAWYEATQGSRLIPYAWAQALETPEGGAPFFAPAHMTTFGYLAPEATSSTGLPVGFVVDDHDDTALSRTKLRWFTAQGSSERWLGMNCSACHTAELTYNSQSVRIEGGPATADYQTFMEAFDTSMVATRKDPPRWERFAGKVLEGHDTAANRALLVQAYDQVLDWQKRTAAMNATPMRYGPSRLDAVGLILNRVALLTDGAATGNAPDAPVSFPYLWNTSQSDKLQWNGMAENKQINGPGGAFDYGALGRNVGEVTGVFGDIALRKNAGVHGYVSSVQVENLDAMERQLALLLPPAWPAAFPAIDTARAEEGKALFVTRCARCHEHLDRTDISTKFKGRMNLFRSNEPPGTDIWMACNAYTDDARSGVLAGTKREYLTGTALGENEPAAQLLAVTVKGTIIGKKAELATAAVTAWLGVNRPPRVATTESLRDERAARRQRCESETNETLGYKARPLTGIWATAPYLHNGSVPTLYDLLLPPENRPRTFSLGTREYDPAKVGYRSEPSSTNRFVFNTHLDNVPIDGNSNAGHDYGNGSLTDAQRNALVEYMKTL